MFFVIFLKHQLARIKSICEGKYRTEVALELRDCFDFWQNLQVRGSLIRLAQSWRPAFLFVEDLTFLGAGPLQLLEGGLSEVLWGLPPLVTVLVEVAMTDFWRVSPRGTPLKVRVRSLGGSGGSPASGSLACCVCAARRGWSGWFWEGCWPAVFSPADGGFFAVAQELLRRIFRTASGHFATFKHLAAPVLLPPRSKNLLLFLIRPGLGC